MAHHQGKVAIPSLDGLMFQHLRCETRLEQLLGAGLTLRLKHPGLGQALRLHGLILRPPGLLFGHLFGFHRLAERFGEIHLQQEIRFAQRFHAAVLAIRRGEEVLRDRLGQVSLQLGDALLLQSTPSALRALQVSPELLLPDPAALPEDRRDRLGWALGLTTALLLLALWRSDALAIWALLVVVGLVVSGVLSAQEVYGAVRWDVVVLLGSLLPLAQLGTVLGLDRWLVEHLSGPIASWPPYLLLLGLYLITALVTEVVSNQAAVTLMLPLGLALSQGVGVSPWAAMGVRPPSPPPTVSSPRSAIRPTRWCMRLATIPSSISCA